MTYQILDNQSENYVLNNLTIIIISDMRSMEDQLSYMSEEDPLLYLRGFSIDKVRHVYRNSCIPTKISVQGNHILKKYSFQISGT